MHHTRKGCVIRSIPGLSYLSTTLSRSRYCSLAHMVSPSQKASDEYRLPTNIKPTHYDVTIKTDIENQVFEGFVQIK